MDPLLEELAEAGDGDDEIELILKLRAGSAVPAGVRIVARFGDIATCRVRRRRVPETWASAAVVSAKAPRLLAAEVEPPDAEDADELGDALPDAPRAAGATGRGVVVGIVDWGIDVAHDNFRRDDGGTRLLALWDQAAAGAGGAPAPYGYGRVHDRAAIDRALATADPYAALGYDPAGSDPFDDGAHGTHVCDIAAGNGRAAGSGTGVAPHAELVFVHLAAQGTGGLATLGDTCRILEALDFVARVAGARPWVANLSVGRCGGPHNGLTLVEQGMDQLLLQAPGRCIVQSTGNYYASHGHAGAQLRPDERRTLTWWTDAADRTPNELEVWYPGVDELTVELHAPDGALVARVSQGGHADVTAGGRPCGRIYHRRHDPSNGDHHVDVFLWPGAPAGAWRLTLVGTDVVDGRFDAWVERDSSCASCQSRFDARDAVLARTTGTICNALRTVAVGAYDSRRAERPLARFSSAGPTRDGRQKPDLCAPGVRIRAARSAPRGGTGAAGGVTVKSGTSMAAPHVTGTVACMFEAAPRALWIHETRRLLLGSARGVNAPPELAARLGSGYLDTPRAIAAARGLPLPAASSASSAPAAQRIQRTDVPPSGGTMMTPEFTGGDGRDEDERYAMEDAGADVGPLETPAFIAGAESEPPDDLEPAAYVAAPDEPSGEWWESLHEAAPEEAGLQGPGGRLVELAEAALHEGGGTLGAAELIEHALAGLDDGLAEALGARGDGAGALASLFDAMTGRATPAERRRLAGRFTVIAAPGDRPGHPLAAGDIFVRRPAGESRLVHAGILVTGDVVGHDELAWRRWTAERGAPGGYALVIEGGALPHCAHRPFARRMLDERGCIPAGQIVLRAVRHAGMPAHGGMFAAPSAEQFGEAGGDVPGDVVLLEESRGSYGEADAPRAGGPPPTPTTLAMRPRTAAPAKPPVRARILWPALGFPAVVEPRARPAASQMLDADATRCVCVLLLSDRPHLSKEEAARYLRYVSWDQRGRRHIKQDERTGHFREEELAVRNDVAEPRLTVPGAADRLSTLVAFGGDRDGSNAIAVTLANRVLAFYRAQGLGHLHEIRVSEAASGSLRDGLYHLFWNNESQAEAAPSDEMALLLQRFARPRRERLGELWQKLGSYLLSEYEYEYGGIHPPYANDPAVRQVRAEVLHPLFVERRGTRPLRIGHVTDTHVDVRADVYAENLRWANPKATYKKWRDDSYNDWNKNFARCYGEARANADVVLLTGDLIDYGRGHWGLPARDRLADDDAYHEDRNWFLLSYLLSSGGAYTRPVYTILGNHDWRLNPYPPFAPGAPGTTSLIHNYRDFSEDERKAIVRSAHGPGHDRKFSYYAKATSKLELLLEQPRASLKALWDLVGQTSTLDEKHVPTETTVESVAWYLLTINPFLDYAFALPSGHRVLMLDWAEDENVLFPIVVRGQEWPYLVWQASTAADPGPKARNCLTALQKRLVEAFTAQPGQAKIVGIHAPPIGPYPDWLDGDLLKGWKVYANPGAARGPTNYATRRPDGSIEKWNGHPFFAVQPSKGQAGMVADYGSFESERAWFLRKLGEPRAGVRFVFSGHIHRNGLLVVYTPGAGTMNGPAVAGQLLVRGVVEHIVRGVRPPAVAKVPEGTRGPLYVNTTSAGPRGNLHPRLGQDAKVDPGWAIAELASDGTIVRVEFRTMGSGAQRPPAVQAPVAPAVKAPPAGVPVGA